MTWPGFAGTARDPSVHDLRDLSHLVEPYLAGPSALVAHSMGGVVAMMTAIANPDQVSRLVLVATSGGIDMTRFGASDWRPQHGAGQRGKLPTWFADDRTDLTAELATLAIPTLLIYGDADDIAPVAAGEFLRHTLPNATLEVIVAGRHDMARERPDEVGALIEAFITA